MWDVARRGEKTMFTAVFNMAMTPRDHEILVWLAEFLGTSRADAARTAIRAFAVQMKSLEKNVGGRP